MAGDGRDDATARAALAAEAHAVFGGATCDGQDRHDLVGPRWWYWGLIAAGAALTVAIAALGLNWRTIALPVGIALGGAFTLWARIELDGDTLVSGTRRSPIRTPLDEVTAVERRVDRGRVSLRLWTRDSSKPRSVPVSAGRTELDPVAAAHLLRYLDHPGVSWGPGAWELLTSRAPGWGGHHAPSPSPSPSAGPEPRGARVANRPPTRRERRGQRITMVVLGIVTVMFVVYTPIAWTQYAESQTIQNGGRARALILGQTTSTSSDRLGTHETTHFLVQFRPRGGQRVYTTINAGGDYPFEYGQRIRIRYDPGNPQDAELPGHPNHTLLTALALTGVTLFAVFVSVTWLRVTWRVRRGSGAPSAGPV